MGPDRDSIPGTPRWVKVFGVIALALVLLLLVSLLIGGHGPGRHTLSADPGGQTPPSRITDLVKQQP